MSVTFNYPYTISQDTPAVASEVQTNLDQLLAWINANFVQKDDSPGFDVNIEAPLTSDGATQVVQKAYVDAVIPTGSILMWAGGSLPDADEWEWCRGSAQSQTDPKYADLYAVIGVDYGDPGGGNFNLPDLQARFPVGYDSGEAAFDDLGETGGSRDAINVSHTHTDTFAVASANASHTHGDTFSIVSGGAHTHSTVGAAGTVYAGKQPGTAWSRYGSGSTFTNTDLSTESTSSDGAHTHTLNGSVSAANAAHSHTLNGSVDSAGSSGTDANLPPYTVVNYIIKL